MNLTPYTKTKLAIPCVMALGLGLLTWTAAAQDVPGLQHPQAAIQAASRIAKAGANGQAVSAVPSLTSIQVSFKLDPRLTRSLYMGERWVSPRTYISAAQAGSELTVEARVRGVDARSKPRTITPEWIPADPDMVTVSPTPGHAVRITVRHAGESRLQVVSQGVIKELRIKATDKGNVMQVEISQ